MAFTDYPTTEPRSISYKLIGIIGGGVLIAVIILGGVLRFVRQSPGVAQRAVEQQATISRIDACSDALDPEHCRLGVVEQVVKQSKAAVELCGALPEQESDGCFWKFAREQRDPTVCDSVKKDSIKTNCRDSAYFELATSNNDVSECDKIESVLQKKACRQRVLPPLTPENCLELGNDATFCQTYTVSERAIATQDPEVCQELNDADQISFCTEVAVVDDPDFDQLNAYDESVYGTDPRNADTDGDGFKDGDEVAAGYNPAGPGKLETQSP